MNIKILFLISFTALVSGSEVGVKNYVCEKSQLTLGCRPGYYLKILRASYGRTNSNICPDIYIKTTTCSSSIAENVVIHKCYGRKICTINASNEELGDPCPGTFKYLEVESVCVPDNGKLLYLKIIMGTGKVVKINKTS